tara:strand:- start:178 stop:528 length:351 start_codon:yes stop_codon:yes gene_type:complete
MGLSVELFMQDDYGDWTHVECLYTSMIGPSRQLITNTMNSLFNENMPEGFVWGQVCYNYGGDECYLTETSNNNVTKISFNVLKTVWKISLNEELELDKENEDIIDNNTIVCLATGN